MKKKKIVKEKKIVKKTAKAKTTVTKPSLAERYNKDKNWGGVYANFPITTPPMRCCWVDLKAPKEFKGETKDKKKSEPKYGLTLLAPENSKKFLEWKKEMTVVVKEMLTLYNKDQDMQISGVSIGKTPKPGEIEKYPHYEGMKIIRLNHPQQPHTVGVDPKEDIPASEIKAGNVVVCVFRPMMSKTGLAFRVEIVQKVLDDGVSYGGYDKSAYIAMLGDASTYEDADSYESEPAGKKSKSKTKAKAESQVDEDEAEEEDEDTEEKETDEDEDDSDEEESEDEEDSDDSEDEDDSEEDEDEESEEESEDEDEDDDDEETEDEDEEEDDEPKVAPRRGRRPTRPARQTRQARAAAAL